MSIAILHSCGSNDFKQKELTQIETVKTNVVAKVTAKSISKDGLIDSVAVLNLKRCKIIFSKYRPEWKMWYDPRLIKGIATLKIEGLSDENGSEFWVN